MGIRSRRTEKRQHDVEGLMTLGQVYPPELKKVERGSENRGSVEPGKFVRTYRPPSIPSHGSEKEGERDTTRRTAFLLLQEKTVRDGPLQ